MVSQLFINLRRSFKRATPLHMSHVLFDLHRVWGKHLKAYAKKVLEQLPKVTEPADPSLPPTCNIDLAAQARRRHHCHGRDAAMRETPPGERRRQGRDAARGETPVSGGEKSSREARERS